MVAWARTKLRELNAQDDAFSRHYRQRLQDITALSREEAHRHAELLLAEPQKFACLLVPSPADVPDIFAPSLHSLFSRFRRIQAIGTEFVLDRDEIARFGWDAPGGPWRDAQFWQIGTGSEHTVILVKTHQEDIYETDGLDEDFEEPDYASVYHWLLMIAEWRHEIG